MGLFERINRKAQKLGISRQILDFLPYLSLLAVIGGLGWLLILPVDGQFRRTYISENALMPAQAETYFRESEWNIVRGYREEVHSLEWADEETRSSKLLEWFEDIGLKASIHHWSVGSGSETKNGSNVYGILHAPRGDSTEAMVLVAPWINKDGEYNDGGVALSAALARYFKRWNIWSKNIIFVVTTDSHFAMRSWVSAYHTSLKNTAGSIEGAIVLDYPNKHDYMDEVEIYYDGLNGQLPNLDLYNTAVESAGREGIRVIMNGMHVGYTSYLERLGALLKGIFRQCFAGILAGPGSENFSGWRIDAVTLRARGSNGPYDITSFGRVAESIFRSINNLLEHFHQSFFFYLLLSPKYFVSIGTYLPAAMAVAHSFPIMAIYQFFSAPQSSLTVSNIWFSLAIESLVIGASILYGYFLLALPSEMAPTIMVISYVGIALIGPFIIRQFSISAATVRTLQIISLVLHGLYLTTLATTNFALSIAIGLFTVPLAWIRPGNLHLTTWTSVLQVVSSPWAGLFALTLYTGQSWSTIINGILWGWRGLDLWTWGVIIGVWLPAWIIGMVVANANDQSRSTAVNQPTRDNTLQKKKLA